MPILFCFRGLPGAGKTVERRRLLADASNQPIMAVNKDEIRIELGILPGEFDREKEVKALERQRIQDALNQGVNVIVDNTHNSPKYTTHYTQLAETNGYEFRLVDLSHVPVEECIRRDALRTGREHVGEAVIRRMWNDFYKPQDQS